MSLSLNKILTFLTFLCVIITCAFGQTHLYQKFWTVFPQFAIGNIDNTNYTSVLQVTNKHREDWWYGVMLIHGTVLGRFIANYTINGIDYSGYQGDTISVPPGGTSTFVFESDSPLKTGFIYLSAFGSEEQKGRISTSFFFQLRDIRTGELADSVGVAPSDFGWKFAIPITVSADHNVNTGVAIASFPLGDEVQVVVELWDAAGKQLDIQASTLQYSIPVTESQTNYYPYHKAQFVTEIFAQSLRDYFHENANANDDFHGSIRIYAQRNINVLALRVDTRFDGNIELTSIPTKGELCIDGHNYDDVCFRTETEFEIGWVPSN